MLTSVRLALVPILFTMVSIFATAAVSRELDWTLYRDAETGCRLDYPKVLFPENTREEGEPLKFVSHLLPRHGR
jgi:hypothetical protein